MAHCPPPEFRKAVPLENILLQIVPGRAAGGSGRRGAQSGRPSGRKRGKQPKAVEKCKAAHCHSLAIGAIAQLLTQTAIFHET